MSRPRIYPPKATVISYCVEVTVDLTKPADDLTECMGDVLADDNVIDVSINPKGVMVVMCRADKSIQAVRNNLNRIVSQHNV